MDKATMQTVYEEIKHFEGIASCREGADNEIGALSILKMLRTELELDEYADECVDNKDR